MDFIWNQWIFLILTSISLPLYISIIIITIREWKNMERQKTVNLLVISQGIADIVVVINYMIFITVRTTGLFSDIYWNLQNYYVATWSFAQYYFTVVLRALGILLITVHRYITMCKDGSSVEQWANSSNRWFFVLIHWVFPPVYILPFLCRNPIPFNNPADLDPAPDHELISLANLLSVVFVVPSFSICILCYAAILRFLYKHRVDLRGSLRRERLVCTQMMGVFVAFALVMIYLIMQYNFSLKTNGGPIIQMRVVYPLVSSFLSYVNPWMMVLTTKDLRRKLCEMYGLRKKQTLVSSVGMISTQFVRSQCSRKDTSRKGDVTRNDQVHLPTFIAQGSALKLDSKEIEL